MSLIVYLHREQREEFLPNGYILDYDRIQGTTLSVTSIVPVEVFYLKSGRGTHEKTVNNPADRADHDPACGRADPSASGGSVTDRV